MFKTLFLLTTLALSSVASAEWKHITLETAEGVTVQLDYDQKQLAADCYRCDSPILAAPLWIHVKSGKLKASDRVRVVLLNKWRYSFTSFENSNTLELDLAPMGDGVFSAEVKKLPIHAYNASGSQLYRQEMAIVINGQWLKKFDGSSNNIDFKLYWK